MGFIVKERPGKLQIAMRRGFVEYSPMKVAFLALATCSCLWAQQGPSVVLETSKGVIKIELLADAAPRTVDNFLRYVDTGFYADTVFHRVIPKFVVQGGGFTPELELKPTLKPSAIETKNGLVNERGTVAMARTDDKDSATSQFFINLANNEELNRSAFSYGYTVFGRVIEGMDVVDAIAGVQTSKRGQMEDVPILPVFLDRAYRAH